MLQNTRPKSPSRRATRARRSRAAHAHAPIERIFRIHVLVIQGERVTAPRIADEFEVDTRTVLRDIDFMRRRLGIAITYHPKWGSYYYECPCPVLPLFRLTPKDIHVLTMANQRFAAWAGRSMGGMLHDVFKKFVSIAGGAVEWPGRAAASDFAPLTEFAAREQEQLAPVWEAMERRRELRITYRKARSAVMETRTIQPLHVDCPGRRWILIARDLARSDYRTFRLGRIFPRSRPA